MPCTPPFYPCPGHEDRGKHDRSAACRYYAVWRGEVRGVFTNSWMARDQVSGITDGKQQAFKKWDDLEVWWRGLCKSDHPPGRCPPFERLNISLVPHPVLQPGAAPCRQVAPVPAVPSAPAPIPQAGPAPTTSASSSSCSTDDFSSVTTSSDSEDDNTPACCPYHARSGAKRAAHPDSCLSPSASTSSCIPHSCIPSVAPAASPFTASVSAGKKAPLSPTPKKEEPRSPQLFLAVPRVTPQTRVQLSPTGPARAQALSTARPTSSAAAPSMPRTSSSFGAPSTPARSSTLAASPIPSTPAPALAPAPALSVALTLNAAAAPAPAPIPAPPRRQYGIRGVSIFYPSHGAAAAAAAALGLPEARIMVSDNPAKLEAWMMGLPFLGE